MTYEQSLEYLASLNRFGINLGLVRIEKLLALMGHPERQFKTIHVTGTNGKGSTTAMISSILSASGIKTGMYTSPHLIEYTERVTVDGNQITKDGFAEAVWYTSRFVDSMIAEGCEHPTEFEVITAAAFHFFASVGVEYAVIEVGLGGLLDSTNVIIPEVAVITNVALEHTDRCGDTIEAIAGHKAGIIKPGVPVVTAADGTALEVIWQKALAMHSPVYRMGTDFTCRRTSNRTNAQTVVWQREGTELGPVAIPLLGSHQVLNAAVAIMVIKVLAVNDTRITGSAVVKGLEAVRWPGRFEFIAGKPSVIIDGAHNPAGAQTLRQGLDEYFPQKHITFVLGILKDKDVGGIIRALLRKGDRVITAMPDTERASRSEELLAVIRETAGVTAVSASSLEEAITKAAACAGPEGVVCIAGSLYLVGPAREIVYRR